MRGYNAVGPKPAAEPIRAEKKAILRTGSSQIACPGKACSKRCCFSSICICPECISMRMRPKFWRCFWTANPEGRDFVSARGGIFSSKQWINLGLPPIADPNMPPTVCWKGDMVASKTGANVNQTRCSAPGKHSPAASWRTWPSQVHLLSTITEESSCNLVLRMCTCQGAAMPKPGQQEEANIEWGRKNWC